MNIINNIQELKETVRVNADSPFEDWLIFLNDARDKFLISYLGLTLIENLEKEAIEDKYSKVLPMVRRTLGPYAMMLASAESSINFGNNGHTVTKSNNTTPASDSKIEKAKKSLRDRAWRNLESLLEYLENNIEKYPEWEESKYYKNKQTRFFPSAETFQDSGLIDIDYSRFTFEKLRHLIIRIEKSEIKEIVPEEVQQLLITKPNNNELKIKLEKLIESIRSYIGARVGELHTSEITRVQRSKNNSLEYEAIVRPLYDNPTDNMNYYSGQASFWKEEIKKNLTDFGIDVSIGKTPWDNKAKHIFSAII